MTATAGNRSKTVFVQEMFAFWTIGFTEPFIRRIRFQSGYNNSGLFECGKPLIVFSVYRLAAGD